MYHLLCDPQQLAEVEAEPLLLASAINEALRMEAPVAVIGRVTVAEAEVAGVRLPAGCPVNVNLSVANRDPARWVNPDRFDVRRPDSDRHLSFSTGAHACLGAALARAELEVMCGQTVARLPNLRLAHSATRGVHMTGVAFRMVTSLPVIYGPSVESAGGP